MTTLCEQMHELASQDNSSGFAQSPSPPTVSSEPSIIDKARSALANLNSESSNEDFLIALNFLDSAKQIVADYKELWKSVALERCQHSGQMILGERKFYAGYKTTKKCPDVRHGFDVIVESATMEGLDETTGEVLRNTDWEVVKNCLSANAFKPRETETVVGDRFKEIFDVTRGPQLEDGVPSKRELLEINERFLKGNNGP